ncbi:MAG TPA: pyrroloquinoline quinone biosynthesis protein PqqE [Gemmatimonadales bacterium]|nr:pyrroloquinoline quinone biosynthesis protein PqqE [Gemmatimonadales bacterium]
MLPKPLWLLAELTYRCPLQCPYCSNPVEFAGRRFRAELSTNEWQRVLREAKALGVLQLGLSGGEPTLRPDLEALVRTARGLGMYQTLVTSAYRLTRDRLAALKDAGLDHVQISIQAADADLSDRIAGATSYEDKLAAYRLAKELGFPLTVNVVLHRRNLHQVGALIRLAESIGAERIELANTQYYGWALHNRSALLPTREQIAVGWDVVQRERARLGNRLEIVWVLPDYYEEFPKPCMGGWGRAYMTVTPAGEVWPCQAAGSITTLEFANVREHSLEWIWNESDAFQRFRGDAWMREPCRSCARKTVDFGGCRCQAFLVAGDAALADPVCSLSPERGRIDQALQEAERPWTYRAAPPSRALAEGLSRTGSPGPRK